MSVFAVTIRLNYSSDYSDRLESVQKAMKRHASSAIWDDATSLYIFEGIATSKDILDSIKYCSGFNLAKDGVLVMNLSIGTHQVYGFGNQTLLDSLLSHMNQAA